MSSDRRRAAWLIRRELAKGPPSKEQVEQWAQELGRAQLEALAKEIGASLRPKATRKKKAAG